MSEEVGIVTDAETKRAGEALHKCTLIDRRDGGEPLYRCDGCGQHLLGLHFMQLHRSWEEIKHLRAERDLLLGCKAEADALRAERDELASAVASLARDLRAREDAP